MPNRPKKIALVYDAIYPYIKGGGERRYYEMGKALTLQGFDVHLYGMKLWDGPRVIKRDGLTLHGLGKARKIYHKNGKRSIKQAILFGLSAFKLVKEDFDAIDCCGFPYFSMFPAKLAAKLKGKPLYATWHEVWGRNYWKEYLGKLGLIGFWVEKAASTLPNTIIAGSTSTALKLEQVLKVSRYIPIVENGINIKDFKKIKANKPSSDLIYVGRLMRHKNIDILLEAIANLNDKNIFIKATILGEGPEEGRLQKLAKTLEIQKNITWLKFQEKSDDVYAYIKSSKLLVLPSSREGFGMVVLEANACGRPVITLDHVDNGARNLIKKDANGLLYDGSPEQLAKQIIHCLSVPKNQWEKRCFKASEEYDWLVLASKLKAIYLQ